jgi:hypothetical protein
MKKIVMFLIFLFSGCTVVPFVASPIITGVIIWRQGEAHKYYNEELKTIYRATKHALESLGHKVIVDHTIKNGYYIVAGDKDKFKISIRKVKDHITDVCVRINFMGDKPYAELFYQEIDANTNTIYFNSQGEPVKLKTKVSANLP